MTTATTPSRISQAFADLAARGEKALMPYVTVGHPLKESTLEIVPALVEGGATMIELGIPFSDPLADGPTIQRSGYQALQNGVTMEFCMETARQLRQQGVEVPLILMGYYNPVLRYGLERFVADSAESGIDGFIIPDLPPDESAELAELSQAYQRDLIFMVAPTSRDQHIASLSGRASGFIYCVSVTGVTGARDDVSADLAGFLSRVRSALDLPLAVGFGISTPEHVQEVGRDADGVIVGSALISRLDEADPAEAPTVAREFMRYLRGNA
ncbi:MAG: tryptophan synthase subunit alpha [Sphaerobacteraceae bacterium]|nr:MAG: tryptophan synthase subunit alpha [Sphaerobacteraceae bacterium]